MTNRSANPTPDELGDLWNGLINGHAGGTSNSDSTTQQLRGLHARTTNHSPTATFRDSLKGELMSMNLAQQSGVTTGTLSSIGSLRLPGGRAIGSLTRSRFVAIAATILLLLGTVIGTYIGLDRSNDPNNPGPAVAIQASPDPSPEATELPAWFGACDRYGPYAPCGGRDEVGRAYLRFYDSSDEAKGATQVQLQRWTIEPGTVLTGNDAAGSPAGFAIDFVNDGLYQAEFSTDVAVMRRESTTIYRIEYPAAGQMIELGQGDTVTFPIGSRTSVGNPSGLEPLTFRTAIFYPGNIDPPTVSASEGAEAIVIGDASLPMPLEEFSGGDVFVSLTYTLPRVGYPFPPQRSADRWDPYTWILGPVDAQPWSEVAEDGGGGFMLWIEIPRG